jgi:hypothetical protein
LALGGIQDQGPRAHAWGARCINGSRPNFEGHSMSHAATNWAIKQRDLSPTTKLLLWHLADCHNGHTGQCNPRQATLAYDLQVSRSTINVHLKILEERGLIRRLSSVNQETGKQEVTSYILSFNEPQFPMSENRTRTQDVDEPTQDVAVPCPETGHGTVSGFTAKPCPDSQQNRVRNPDTIENPGIEPGKEPCVSEADPHTDFFEKFWKAHPRTVETRREDARAVFNEVIAEGTDPKRIIASAKSYAIENEGNKPQYIAHAVSWLNDERWNDYPEPQREHSLDAKIAQAKRMAESPVDAVRRAGLAFLEKLEEAK